MFYKTFYGFAMAICMRYCPNNDDAMEVVNDGFMKIFKGLQSFQVNHANVEATLKSWIKSIMVNTSIDHFRKNNKNIFNTNVNELQIMNASIDEVAVDRMGYKEIMAIVNRLSPAYRTIFNLYAIDGYTHEQIAKQLNISAGTSKSNLAKARANIKKMLTEAGCIYHG
ncbi:MAG: sigma-70 family RNA polymerase sigma factor [Ferruginibacter sp.]